MVQYSLSYIELQMRIFGCLSSAPMLEIQLVDILVQILAQCSFLQRTKSPPHLSIVELGAAYTLQPYCTLLDAALSVQVDQSEQLFSAIANVTGSGDSPQKLHERYRRLTSLEGASQCIPNLDE